MTLVIRAPLGVCADFFASHKGNGLFGLSLFAAIGVMSVALSSVGTRPHLDGFTRPPSASDFKPTAAARIKTWPSLASAGPSWRALNWGEAPPDASPRAANDHRTVDFVGALFDPPAGFVAAGPRHASQRFRRKAKLAGLARSPLSIQFQTAGAPDVIAAGIALPRTTLEPWRDGEQPAAKETLVMPKSLDPADSENRRARPLGIAADTMRFDDRPGSFSSAAETARWNGQPAAVMGIGYTSPDGRARVNATGVTGVTSMTTGLKTFGVSAVASIALE